MVLPFALLMTVKADREELLLMFGQATPCIEHDVIADGVAVDEFAAAPPASDRS